MQFPIFREERRGGLFEVFELFFKQFSVNYPDDISRENSPKPL